MSPDHFRDDGEIPIVHGDDDPPPDDRATGLVELAPSVQQAPTPQCACFLVVSGKKSLGQVFKLRGSMVIGRAIGAEVALHEDGVSRRHAQATVCPDGVEITDIGSSNGVMFEKRRVSKQLLREGQRVGIGSATLMLVYMDDVEAPGGSGEARPWPDVLVDRKRFSQMLAHELGEASRLGMPLSLCVLCVDQYKQVHDAHGPAAAEFVVRRLAQIIGEQIQIEGTVLTRYGEQEIMLLMPNTKRQHSVMCAEWIRRSVQSANFSYSGLRLAITVTGGVINCNGLSRTDEAIDCAQRNLCRAILKGRNAIDSTEPSIA
jgi:diguanylate cyclase (GGDEF)-like protein